MATKQWRVRKPRERTVEQHLKDQVRRLAGKCYKQGSRFAAALPDQHVRLLRGIEFYVEAKRLGEDPTPAQLDEHHVLRSLGARVYVADTKERVDEILRHEVYTACVRWLRAKRVMWWHDRPQAEVVQNQWPVAYEVLFRDR